MKGLEVKKKLQKNGYKLVDIAEKLEIPQQNLQSLLKSNDVKSGLLEKICAALDKDITFFYNDNVLENETKAPRNENLCQQIQDLRYIIELQKKLLEK